MTNINIEVLTKLYHSHYLEIVAGHGITANDAFTFLLDKVKKIYNFVEPNSAKERIIIFKQVEADLPLFDNGIEINVFQDLVNEEHSKMVIQCLSNGKLIIWKGIDINATELSKVSVVYRFENDAEYFHYNEQMKIVEKAIPGFPSQFCIPSFDNLNEALEHYRTKLVRRGTCLILRDGLIQPNRIFFNNAPEKFIRNSLWNFLISSLRGHDDAEIMPEQNVNEKNPVDIKIAWNYKKHVALIEIKWLGKSYNVKDTSKYTANYNDQKGRDGASQLSNYIDVFKTHEPHKICKGYYVIVDARRNVTNYVSSINQTDGMHYANTEISFSPEFHITRSDVFEKPFRMFLEPVYTLT